MKSPRVIAHALVNWDGMHHCGPRMHSPTCDKATEIIMAVIREVSDAAADAGPPAPRIHHLECGITACPMSAIYGVPGEWPEGHKWSIDWTEVTCEGCLRWKPKA